MNNSINQGRYRIRLTKGSQILTVDSADETTSQFFAKAGRIGGHVLDSFTGRVWCEITGSWVKPETLHVIESNFASSQIDFADVARAILYDGIGAAA